MRRKTTQPRTLQPAALQAPDDGDDAPKKAEKNYITPPGYKKLVEEFDFLRAKKRPEVVNALSDAAAEGDRSENAEYIYRKRQLRQIDGRLRFLSKRLDNIAVVDPKEQKRKDKIFFGATVWVEDEDAQKYTYRIVGADETDATSGAISWQSPVGRALLGREVGDAVTVRFQERVRELTVVAVDYI